MPRWQRRYLCACAGVIGFALLYVACDYADWPRLTYFPHERMWAFSPRLSQPAPMNYVGTIVWGLAGGLGAGLVTWLVLGWARAPWPERWLRLFGGWAVAAFAYAGMYYTWNLWPF